MFFVSSPIIVKSTQVTIHFFFFFQHKQLSIILMSLQDDRHVATLLGFSCANRANEDLSESQVESGKVSSICKTTDTLLKTLLGNLSFQVVGGTSLRYSKSWYMFHCRADTQGLWIGCFSH